MPTTLNGLHAMLEGYGQRLTTAQAELFRTRLDDLPPVSPEQRAEWERLAELQRMSRRLARCFPFGGGGDDGL